MLKQLNKSFLPSFFWLFLVAAWLLLLSTSALAKQIEAGRILMATVGVTAEQPNTSPRTLARRSVIFVGDTIKTPEGGRVQLRMLDGEILSLTAASELVIDAFEYQPDVTEAKNSNVKSLVTGGLRTITGAVKGDDYEMKSRAGTIGIRGTAFEAYTQQGENLFVRVQNGNVVIRNNYGSVNIGVNQALLAARIMSRGAAPQAISPNALPGFMQNAFNQEPELPAASNNSSPQEFDNPDLFSPPLLDGFSTGNQGVDLNDAAKDKQAEDAANNPTSPEPQPPVEPPIDPQPPVEPPAPPIDPQPPVEPQPPFEPEPVDPEPVDPEPVDPQPVEPQPSVTYSGFVVGGAFNASQSQALGGYFGNVTESNKANQRADYSASKGQAVFDFKTINSFNFNSSENWKKYVLGYSDVVIGSHACTNCVNGEVNEQAFYQYAFATNMLRLDQLPSNGEFYYHLNTQALQGSGFLTSGNLDVNFATETMIATLKSQGLVWQGEGSLEAFYNSSIRLNAYHTNVLSDMAGRFIGKNAEGAVIIYKLITDTEGVDYKTGATIFERH